MNTIIAGRFEEQARADQAVTALGEAGFPTSQTATFFVNPPGQHDRHGTTDDPDASAGAHHAGGGAVLGAAAGTGVGAVVGLATLPVLGPVAGLAGVAVGAYVGSLAGALEQMNDPAGVAGHATPASADRDEVPPRKSGMLVAVDVTSSAEQSTAIEVLRMQGAADIERAQGNITRSHWNDFDPLRAPTLISITA
jgi:hypothetical protein